MSDSFKTLMFWFLIIFCIDIHAKSLMTPNSLIDGCVVYTYQEPYQYIVDRSGIPVFQGVDIDILSSVLGQQRMPHFKQMTFNEGVEALKSGECDFMLGAPKYKPYEDVAYYSIPYVQGSHVLYHRDNILIKENTLEEFLRQYQGKRIGIQKQVKYQNELLARYVQSHPERFFFVENERQLIQSLQTNHIDVFFADKLQMELLLWKSGFHASIKPSDIQLQPENFYILMSKKTISPEFVAWFNQRLASFKQTAQYSSLVRGYSVPIFISMLTSTTFYQVLEILGTMFYAIAGLILAREAKFSLTGAFILAMLPGIGGGVMRDLFLNRVPVSALKTPLYFSTVVGTTFVFFCFIRMRRYFSGLHKISDFFHEHMFVKEFSIIQAMDVVGLAVYTIIGVMVAIEAQVTPLWLWGPTIAVLSSTGGGILRDFFMGRGLVRTYFYETSFLWGCFLTFYIIYRTENISAAEISNVIIFTVIGIVLTRIAFLKSGRRTKDFWH